MSQGKAWDKVEVIEVLKPLFRLGMSVTKACKTAGIAQSTVQTWIDNDEELRLKIEAWTKEPDYIARKIVVDTLKDNKNKDRIGIAVDWLEKREKDEFSRKTESENKNDDTLRIIETTEDKPK